MIHRPNLFHVDISPLIEVITLMTIISNLFQHTKSGQTSDMTSSCVQININSGLLTIMMSTVESDRSDYTLKLV